MRAKKTLSVLIGSIAVYLSIAACGAASDSHSVAGDAGVLDAFVEALSDALASPVKDANAGPTPPLVGRLTGPGTST
jgi:hypothetical protein